MLTVRKVWLAVLICTFLLYLPAAVLAQMTISEDIEVDTTWTVDDSPINIVENIIVMEGRTLTIRQGVELRFGHQKALTVHGRLDARGTLQEPILFTSENRWDRWGYILFTTTSIDAVYDADGNYTDGSILEHCVIERAGSANLKDNAALILKGAAPYVHNCVIRDNLSRGIEAYDDAKPHIVGNLILNNRCDGPGAGLHVRSRGEVVIRDNIIRQNSAGGTGATGGGIHAYGYDKEPYTILIENNLIEENSSTYNGGGIYARYARIRTNIIRGNRTERQGGGLFGLYTTVEQNVITDNVSTGEGGGGVGMNYGVLINNVIADNSIERQHASSSALKGGGVSVHFPEIVGSNAVVANSTINYSSTDPPEHGAGLYVYFPRPSTVINNTIVSNQASQLASVGGVFIDYVNYVANQDFSIPANNLYANSGYQLSYNAVQTSKPLDAQLNYWGTSEAEEIDALIYDYEDDSDLADVTFQPFSDSFITTAPMAPPSLLLWDTGPAPGSITIRWAPDPKGATPAGYIVYWGFDDGYLYENAFDVGTETSYTITGTQGRTCRFAVTAYNVSYAMSNDLPGTLVNDNQVMGHESWYSAAQTFKSGSTIAVSAPSLDFGNVTIETASTPVDVIITNSGNAQLDIGTLMRGGPNADAFDIAVDDVSNQVLAPDATAVVSIRFLPQSSGLKIAELIIPSNDGDQPLLSLPLTGVGDPPGAVGTVVWNYGHTGFGAPVIGANGTIYAGSQDTDPGTTARKLYAFNPDGTVKWRYPIEGDAYHATPSIAKDGTIYMSSVYGKKFYAINPDGTTKWIYETETWKNEEGWTWSSPAIGSDGTIYFGSREKSVSTDWENGKLLALNPDGTLKWATVVGTPSTSPAIAPDGTIYTGTGGGHLYAVNPDGTVKWTYPSPVKFWMESHPAIGADGTIYLGLYGYGGYCLAAINPSGMKKWYFTTGLPIKSTPVIGADGTLYVSNGETFYAISPDGKLLWSFALDKRTNTSAAVVGAYGIVYFTAYDKKIYAFNPHGTLKWSLDSGDWLDKAPVLGPDGTLYIGGNLTIMAIATASRGPADSPWPMQSHDAHHSGNFAQTENYFPLVDFTTAPPAYEFDIVNLAPAVSTDPDGAVIGHLWEQLAGIPVQISGAASGNATFKAPNVGADGDQMVFKLTIEDTAGLQSSDTIDIQITDSLVTPAALEFGKADTGTASGPQVVTIANRTDQAVTIGGVVLSDAQNFTIDLGAGTHPVGSLPAALSPGSQATLTVQFTPQVGGIFTETLSIESSDPKTPVFDVALAGQARLDASGESFAVALGEDKTFTGYNIDQVSGAAESDTQNARASVLLGPYQNEMAQAWAGVRFDVTQGGVANQYMDATITMTVTYRLKVDFDALPRAQKGGGSADARLYGWICGYKKELDSIAFIHDAGTDEHIGTATFTQQLSQRPLWTHLYPGKSYEVMAELYVRGDVNAGYSSLSEAEVTVDRITIDFDDQDIQPPPPPPDTEDDPPPTARPGYSAAMVYDQLSGPVEIAVAPDGSVYIANQGTQPGVYKDFVTRIAPDKTVTPQFIADLDGPTGIAVDENGNIYVSQGTENEIRKYGASGNLLLKFESHRPGLSDPDTLTLTDDGRLLAPAENVPSDGIWRIMAFDAASGERLEDYTPTFSFGRVKAVVFDNDRVYVAGSRGNNSDGPVLVAAEGLAPVAFAFNDVLGEVVNGLAIADDGTVYATDDNRLVGITADGRLFVLAENFVKARGIALTQDGCVLVSDFQSGTSGRLVEICPSTSGLETVQARVVDTNGNPVSGATVENLNVPHYRASTDALGFFDLSGWPDASHIYRVSKSGYLPTYTFPRNSQEFGIKNDIMLVSDTDAANAYANCQETRDPTKGTVMGIVVDQNDSELAGARVFLTPASGKIIYLNENDVPDLSLTRTGPSGMFIILNVNPGTAQLSAELPGYAFSPDIEIYENAVTSDALVGESGGGAAEPPGGGGGGGGGGCFINSVDNF